jgi:S1-C subfamily serine protease
MYSTTKITATLLLTMVGGAFSVSINAEELVATPASARTIDEAHQLPPLGFDSQLIAGYGEQVTYVERGSTAFRLGLEEQDVILSLNGKRLIHRDAWRAAWEAAISEGGIVTLKVRDARTGAIATRQTRLQTF